MQQTVACNALHSTDERMCRWLLMMHDRAEGEALPYTHEFLSEMLGANRKSVTMAAQALQSAGLISYRRGQIQIVDRVGLEQGILRMLRHRQGAVRCIPDAALDRGPGRYHNTQAVVDRASIDIVIVVVAVDSAAAVNCLALVQGSVAADAGTGRRRPIPCSRSHPQTGEFVLSPGLLIGG